MKRNHFVEKLELEKVVVIPEATILQQHLALADSRKDNEQKRGSWSASMPETRPKLHSPTHTFPGSILDSREMR